MRALRSEGNAPLPFNMRCYEMSEYCGKIFSLMSEGLGLRCVDAVSTKLGSLPK